MPRLPKLELLLWDDGAVLPPLERRRRPIITWDRFLEAHIEDQRRIVNYVEADRHGDRFARLPATVHEELEKKSAIAMYANNRTARVRFARIVRFCLQQLMKRQDGEPFSWITFAPGQFTMTESAAIDFDIKPLQAWVRQNMNGLNFIGMVEAARYNHRKILGHRMATISWHVHVLCWGNARDGRQVEEICEKVRRRWPSVWKNMPSAHSTLVSKQKVIGKALYMLKSPQDEYRAFVSRSAKVNLASGRYERTPEGRLIQKSRALRPGDRIRMCRVLANRQLPSLLFAGGPEGKILVRQIRERAWIALRNLEREERRMKDYRESMLREHRRRIGKAAFEAQYGRNRLR
jgi:hypothetical protein